MAKDSSEICKGIIRQRITATIRIIISYICFILNILINERKKLAWDHCYYVVHDLTLDYEDPILHKHSNENKQKEKK